MTGATGKPPRESAPLHLLRATRHSFNGLAAAFRNELAFQLDLLLFVVLTPVALWLGRSGVERAVLIGSLFIVLITELLNTGIEKTVDRISYEHHLLSGLAKDFASAAVFCSLVNLVVVWVVVLLG